MAHIRSRDPSPSPYPLSPESRRQKCRERKKSGKGKTRQTREFSLPPSRPKTPEPQPTSSHASPHSSDGSTPRGRTRQPAQSPPSPVLLQPTSLPPSHNPVTMASPSSSHHTASGHNSPRASTSAPPTTAAPATTTLPQWAAYLAAPHPVSGETTAAQGGLNPPPGMPSYGSPPTMENIMQMIFDTQTSIGVLSTAVRELATRMNDLVKNGPVSAQV